MSQHDRRGLPARTVRTLVLVIGAVVAVTQVLGAGWFPTTAHAVPDAGAAPAMTSPPTVTADGLPTWQINGVVWSQVVVGDTVYVTGSFTRARPPGVPVGGPGEIDAQNIFAFDITTGNPVPFPHSLNAQGLAIQASPDGRRIYVGGDFTAIDDQPRGHIAAFDLTTNTLVSTFTPTTDGQVRALAISATTVYAGGNFRSASGQPRRLLAAFRSTDGSRTDWAPTGDDGFVGAMVLTPDQSRVIVGGSFTTINGLAAYGMGAIETAGTGTLGAWAASSRIRTAGKDGAITSLSTDGQQIYGAGYSFGAGATFEGTFAADPGTGAINWVNDCLGDTYAVYPMDGVAYSTSHAHNCSVVGGFPDTNPRSRWQNATASPTNPVGTIDRKDAYGWDFTGLPYAGLLQWYPTIAFGTYTSSKQGAWSIIGNGTYLVLGGEFPRINGVDQQGLVRFATRPTAPNAQGPIYNTGFAPVPTSTESGRVNVAFGSLWDRDDATLTYDIFRNSGPAIASVVKTGATFWDLPTYAYLDTGATPGSSVRYQIRARDAKGNFQWSAWSPTITVSSTPATTYAAGVRSRGASNHWRLDRQSGPLLDDIGALVGTGTSVTRDAAGALTNDSNTAIDTAGGSAPKITTGERRDSPDAVSVEAWIKTTSTRGGRIVGFGESALGTAITGKTDRVLYLDNSGRPNFTINDGSYRTVFGRTAINDGQWHHVVGMVGPGGTELYVDGVRVARSQSYTTAKSYVGYWRIGADQTTGLTNRPTDAGLSGSIDEVAVYPTALTKRQVHASYLASGRTATWPATPTDTYGAAVAADQPDLYWRLSGGPTVDRSGYGNTGNVIGGTTFTAAGAISGDTAATFDGTTAAVVAQNSWFAPTTYTAEAWFKTTSTKGGKIIGFGDSTGALSASYDRHVYMQTTGKITFGNYTAASSKVNLTTAAGYNDGQWHHVVASRGPGGMRLWLDSTLVGSNTDTQAPSSYLGYWRVGADRPWAGTTATYFTGVIDEAAVYSTELTEQRVRAHFTASGRTVANRPPVARFTSTTDRLSIGVDASTSTDPDGSITGYAWKFGDGSTATGATASHVYAAAGTYTVQLTVSDVGGLTSVVSKSVTVVANQAPQASFTREVVDLTVDVDASGSNDPDGSITGYAWKFGDGSTATGATASHAYTTAGTYSVELRVTDSDGATTTRTEDVTVTEPPNVDPKAAFTSDVTNLKVDVDAGTSDDPDGTITGYAWKFGDGATATGATASHSYTTAGTYTVQLTVTDNRGGTDTVTHDVTVSPANQGPSAAFTSQVTDLKVAVDGTTSDDPDGSITAYAWTFGDGATATGSTASHTYSTAGTYTVALTVTDNRGGTDTVTHDLTTTQPANQAPVASFTHAETDLKVALDANGSDDPDGSVASYAWDFGDGKAGTGAAVSHTYASEGTYQVVLTVTDDRGAKDSLTRSVTVSAPAVTAKDNFGRSTTSGWGSADTGGAWALGSSSARYSVSDGTGKILLNAGNGFTARLPQSSAPDVDVRADVSFDKPSTGGGQHAALIGRDVTGAGDYRAKVRVASNGVVTLWVARTLAGTEALLTTVTVPGPTYVPGDALHLRLQVAGDGGTTSLKAKVWSGDNEPTAWTSSATDGTAALQASGGIALYSYLSGSVSNGPVVVGWDNVLAVPVGP